MAPLHGAAERNDVEAARRGSGANRGNAKESSPLPSLLAGPLDAARLLLNRHQSLPPRVVISWPSAGGRRRARGWYLSRGAWPAERPWWPRSLINAQHDRRRAATIRLTLSVTCPCCIPPQLVAAAAASGPSSAYLPVAWMLSVEAVDSLTTWTPRRTMVSSHRSRACAMYRRRE